MFMSPEPRKPHPAHNATTLSYQLQELVKGRRAKRLHKYWEFSRCSVCDGSQCYSLYQAEPHLIDSCTCAQAGRRPATWLEVAQQLLEHGTAEDFAWWGMEPPDATFIQATPAVQIDRVVMDFVISESTTTLIVCYSSADGPGVKVKYVPVLGPYPDLPSLLEEVLQWPDASPTLLRWLEQQPNKPA